MSKINKALQELDKLSQKALEKNWLNNIHPLIKFILVLLYISITVSYSKYDFYGILSLAIIPLVIFMSGVLSFKEALYRLRIILPLIIVIGIFNPIFDRIVVYDFNGLKITSGMISFLTLILKGFLTVLASYIFVASTSIEKLCYALQLIHFPKILITEILLIYRYITVFLSEIKRITQAYSLRAPNQKGIHISAWGSLVGNLLLHSMDRAEEVYESMCLRGFENSLIDSSEIKFRFMDFLILIFTSAFIVALRIFPVFTLLGGLFL